jgi:hypothetical protein
MAETEKEGRIELIPIEQLKPSNAFYGYRQRRRGHEN